MLASQANFGIRRDTRIIAAGVIRIENFALKRAARVANLSTITLAFVTRYRVSRYSPPLRPELAKAPPRSLSTLALTFGTRYAASPNPEREMT